MSKYNEFVICINNDSNPASLILGKVYYTLPDAEAEAHDMLRVVDEDLSEPEGYLYPASMFAPIELPEVARRALAFASSAVARAFAFDQRSRPGVGPVVVSRASFARVFPCGC